MNPGNWHRACQGLYVDPTETWVVERQERSWWTIRACLGYGPLLDGTLFPDMGGIWHGDYRTLSEAKYAVEQMTKNGETPALEPQEERIREMNLARVSETIWKVGV